MNISISDCAIRCTILTVIVSWVFVLSRLTSFALESSYRFVNMAPKLLKLSAPLTFVCLSFFLRSWGWWVVGERAFLRVSNAAVQSHPQLAGALPHESQLRSHRQVVCQALREGWEAHQQEVRSHHLFCWVLIHVGSLVWQCSAHVPALWKWVCFSYRCPLCLLLSVVMWSGAAQAPIDTGYTVLVWRSVCRLLNPHFQGRCYVSTGNTYYKYVFIWMLWMEADIEKAYIVPGISCLCFI